MLVPSQEFEKLYNIFTTTYYYARASNPGNIKILDNQPIFLMISLKRVKLVGKFKSQTSNRDLNWSSIKLIEFI